MNYKALYVQRIYSVIIQLFMKNKTKKGYYSGLVTLTYVVFSLPF